MSHVWMHASRKYIPMNVSCHKFHPSLHKHVYKCTYINGMCSSLIIYTCTGMGNTETYLHTTNELKTLSEYLGMYHILKICCHLYERVLIHTRMIWPTCHAINMYINIYHQVTQIGLVIRMDECVRSNHTQEWFDEYISNKNV